MEFKSLPKIVINLPKRTDRLAKVTAQLSGFDFTVVPGVEHANPMVGIAKAHISAISYAKENNWPQALIMEDDLILRPGFEDHLNQALANLPEDWDLLLGGLYEAKALTSYNDYWNRVGEFCGLHFYIIRSYEVVSSYNERQHIDRWMNLGGKRLNCYVLKKFIATQSNGYSDNVNKVVDYSDRIKRFQLL